MKKPELPPDVLPWSEQTKAWWAAWVESPTTDDWTPLEWAFLLDTAVIHTQFWTGETQKANEIRARVERLGGLPAVTNEKQETPVPAVRKGSTPLDELAKRRAKRRSTA